MDMMDSMDPTMTGVMVVWMLVWVLITLGTLVLIVLGIMRLARSLRHDGKSEQTPAASPRDILDRRYAAGEIDEDEYLTRTSGLSQVTVT